MFTDFFYLYQISTFNKKAAAYQETVMEIKEAICWKRPGLLTKVILLLFSNTRCHTAEAILNLFYSWKWAIFPHSLTCPALAPKKNRLRNEHFESYQNFWNELKKLLRAQDKLFPWRTWYINISLRLMSKEIRWIRAEVKLIWDCISASWVTLHVVSLFK